MTLPTFLSAGGDEGGLTTLASAGGVWANSGGTPIIVQDIVHGWHANSIKFRPATADRLDAVDGVIGDSGGRESHYFYFAALPTATASFAQLYNSSVGTRVDLRMTSGGVIQLWKAATSQIGSNGPTLTTGHWYRISLAHTTTSTTVNRFELVVYQEGVAAAVGTISITNATLAGVGINRFRVGNIGTDATLDFRLSDTHIDNSSALTDPGDAVLGLWVTNKRAVSNGTSNQFTTQVGSGGSGYGSGHAPQVNERPCSIANGWSINSASLLTEEYTIEGETVGDISTQGSTYLGFIGWIIGKVGSASTGHIIVTGTTTAISVTTSSRTYQAVSSATTYPAGGTDIGIDNNSVAQLFTLTEVGMLVSFIPKALTDGETITAAGNYFRVVPAGISTILCHMRAGGGASGASISTSSGGGGGGGESFLDGGTPVTTGDLFLFTVGAGGVGGAGAGGNATKTSVTQNGTAVGPGASGCFAGNGGKVGSLSVAADGGGGGTFSGSPSGLGSTTGNATSGSPAAGTSSAGTGIKAGGGDGGGGCPIAFTGGNGGNSGAASPELGHATPGTGAGAGGASGDTTDGLGTSCGYGGDAPTSAANGNNGQDGGVHIVFVVPSTGTGAGFYLRRRKLEYQ